MQEKISKNAFFSVLNKKMNNLAWDWFEGKNALELSKKIRKEEVIFRAKLNYFFKCNSNIARESSQWEQSS